MSIVKTSIQRPLMMIMVILAIALFGLVAWRSLPIDRMPNMELPYVMVQLIYPGAGPEEVETNVVRPVEDAVSTISGIKNMTSYSMENAGIIVLEFESHISPDFAAIEVKDNVSRIQQNFPSDVLDPIVMKFDFNAMPIMTVALLGDETVSPVELRNYAERYLNERFSRISGVAQATALGGREREIHVILSSEKLQAHGLSIFSVFPALTAQNVLIPAGTITGSLREFAVKFDGQFRTVEEIANIQIPTPRGYNIRLNEIATVIDSYAEVRSLARFQGRESVEISITRAGGANTVEVAKGVRRVMAQMEGQLPPGMSLDIVEDQSIFIGEAVNDTYSNLFQGILLTAIILLVFLANFRVTLIAAITMPVSLIMGFIGMDALGFSMNMVTMMSLAIVVGILVTNAILVLENIVRQMKLGKEPYKAALDGTEQMFTSVLVGTLTNLAVFIPMANTTGITGSIFRELGLTIVFATVASLILSFTLVPIMASRLLKIKENQKDTIVDKIVGKLERGYEKVLGKALRSRFGKLGIVFGVIFFLIFTLTVIASRIGVDFMPSSDEGFITVSLELPVGTPMAITEGVLLDIEERMKTLPYLKAVSTSIGGSGLNAGVENGTVRLEFVPLGERSIDVFQLTRKIRPKLADIPDARIIVAPLSGMAGGSSSDITINILGTNMDTLSMLVEKALEVMRADPDLTDFNSSWKGAKPEIVIRPRREVMEHYGLMGNINSSITGAVIGGLLRLNITGEESAVFRDGSHEYPIRVRLEENSRRDIRDIATMPVVTPRGTVPLEVLCYVEYADGVSQITRINKMRALDVSANLVSTDIAAGTKTPQVLAALIEQIPLPEGYEFRTAGMQDMADEMMEQLLIAAAMAILLTIMVLIGLLESVRLGFVVFLTLPLGLIGVIWALFITGNALSMISMMSIIMLIGLVSTNAILMIDYARQIRKKNEMKPIDAIVKAAGTKLRVILMANIAIVFSMLPMALGMGAGGAFRAPFAITAIGGVIFSTGLTFFFIPVLYVWTASKTEKPVLSDSAKAVLNA
ncbi:MAG: efflux RND transporter permease subunit [Chitinivibrionia bacterium]|nr:efflux RND transporter permease subunit [Chitinivibrionia bacterium]